MKKNTKLVDRVREIERRATGKDHASAATHTLLDAPATPEVPAAAPMQFKALHKVFAVKQIVEDDLELQKQLGINYATMTIPEKLELFDLLFNKMMIDRPADDASESATSELLARLGSGELVLSAESIHAEQAALDALDRRHRGLLPRRHLNRDFFLCDLFEVSIKDDAVTMEAPVFSLSKQKDVGEWTWESADKTRAIQVTPSIRGRATIYDKDILIYITSQITEAMNRKRVDADSRRIRFVAHDYLKATNKTTSGREYDRMKAALQRLQGTIITTDIVTGGVRISEGFGIIDKWKIVEKSKDDDRMTAVEVTISEWLYNAIQAHEVLTLHPDYFRLRKGLEKRMYELARKHCGSKAMFVISEEKLHQKSGSKATPRHFRSDLKEIAQDDNIPEYRFQLDAGKGNWIIYTKDQKRLNSALAVKLNPEK